MLREITIGQYYEADSKVHKLDPRVKLFGTVAYMVALFATNNIFGYILAGIYLAVTIKLSKVPFKFITKGLKTIVLIMAFSVIFSIFFVEGDIILDLKFCTITAQGVVNAIRVVVRLIMLVMGASILTYTTTPTDIADGLEKAFSPLKWIKVPVHEMSMMISIAFRFIPILVEETNKIMKAQMARGADFENGGIIKKAKAVVPLIVPLIISSIRRAVDLATAMEARCYRGGSGRTKMKPLKYKKSDAIGYISLIVLIFACIGTNLIWNSLGIDIYQYIR